MAQPPAKPNHPEATGSSKSSFFVVEYARPLYRLFSGHVAREGYLAAFDQGIISLSNFLAAIILARQISPTEFGVYGVGFLLLHLVRAVQEGVTVQPLNAIGASMDRADFKRYFTGAWILQLALALLAAVVAATGGWLLTSLGNDTAGPALFVLWFAVLVWQPQEYLRRAFYTRGKVRSAVFNTTLASAIRLGVLVYWASQNRLSGAAGIDAIAWGSLGALILGIWQARWYWTWRWSPLQVIWPRNWAFGRWILGGTLANWIAMELYPILAAGIISFAAAGAFRALQNLVAPVHVLLRAIDTFLTPRAARLYSRDGYRGLDRTLRLTYLFAGIAVIGSLLIAVAFPQFLLRLLYGEVYLEYSRGIWLMALFYALWYAYWPLQAAYKAIQLSRPIFIANLAAIASMVTLGIWLIYRWGLYGTIAGQALNALIVGLVLWGTWGRIRRSTEGQTPVKGS